MEGGLAMAEMTADELDRILEGFEARIIQPKSEEELAAELEADARKLEAELAKIFGPRRRARR